MILILGGARSGKSTFAEQRAKALQEVQQTDVLYLATAIAFDKDMQARINKHRDVRPSTWHTIEQYKNLGTLQDEDAFKKSDIILLDCMTLLISNLLLETDLDYDHIELSAVDVVEANIQEEVNTLMTLCRRHNKQLIIVANEVGLGIVPAYRLGGIFRDIAGRINQLLAKESDEVYLLTAGIPLVLKS